VGPITVGELRFDRTSGELRAPAGDVRHLPPQPTALLALLVDRAGEVVTHEEIRVALWPDVTVDFDGSLHHCIRQVRAALGDQAKAPRFIETIPRRGYRLRPGAVGAAEATLAAEAGVRAIEATPRAEVPRDAHAASVDAHAVSVDAHAVSVDAHAALHATLATRSPRRQWLPVMLALLVAGLSAWRLRGLGYEPDELRVAIMAFGSDPTQAPAAERIGEQVLADLANRRPDTAIVGPRTTEPLRAAGLSLPEIAAALDVAYVLNARHMSGDPPSLLVELIRTSDGKHVWVRRYDPLTDWRRIATEITDGAAATLP
jgi:DNA-binding winged helix-turn-helix (wHTH) protein/TolB-like protein